MNKVVIVRQATIRTFTTVSVFSPNRQPAGYVRFLYGEETFYYSEGVYYKKKPRGYVLVKLRTEFQVVILPRGYRVIRDGHATFYNFNNLRYRKINDFFVFGWP